MWQFQIVKSSSHLKDLWVKRHWMQFLTWASLPWWKYSIKALYHCWKEGTLLFCKWLYCYSWHFTMPALISPQNDVWAYVQKFHTTQICRAVTKISTCRVYAVSRWGTEQPGSSFGVTFFIAGGHAYSTQGKSPPDPWPLVTTLQIWVLLLNGWSKFSTNEKHYPDLGSDGSSNGHFMLIPQHHFAGKPVVASQNVGCFVRLEKNGLKYNSNPKRCVK